MVDLLNENGCVEVKVIPVLTKDAFKNIQEGTIIVDIRAEYETNYRVFEFLNIIYLPYESYKENFNIIPKDKAILIVDNIGLNSPEVAKFLISQGYIDVTYLNGGIIAWDHAGLPLKKDLEYEFNGSCGCSIRPKKKY